jgi:hypothetical protein
MLGYTYYGDLLGFSGYYNLNPTIAKDKLNDFYNIIFFALSNYCMTKKDKIKVYLFSDSLLIYGEEPIGILRQLQKAYIRLIEKGLLLRGALVRKKLNFDPRIELSNLEKRLPKDDTLARAVGLEKSQKGARLIIENNLANELLYHRKSWLTIEGYINDINGDILSYDNVLRRICPTPDYKNFEYLYFWELSGQEIDYEKTKDQLKQVSIMLNKEIAEHYQETIRLANRCKIREYYTKDKLSIGEI